MLTSDLERLIALEGCLGGNVPKGATPVGGWSGPCGRLGKSKPVKVVFGPGTFINESVRQIGDQYNGQLAAIKADAQKQYNAAYQLARGKGYSKAKSKALAAQARQIAATQSFSDALKLALKYGLLKAPQVNDPGFVSQLVFAGGKAAGTPKARFAYLFPNANSSLIQVRLKPGLSDGARKDAIAQIRAATNLQPLRLLSGGRYVVTGAPVVLSDLTTKITDAIVTLLIASILVMALVLAVVFRARRRLLPLVVALAAVAITFGALSAIGASLTMASVGVVPVLIGLAVDYAIQLQARIEERAGPRATRAEVVSAVAHVARTGAPAVAIAAAATAAGFLVLGISPVPMVRGFGLLLVGGIFIAWRPRSRSAPRRWSGRRTRRRRRGARRRPARRRRDGRRGGARRRRVVGRQPASPARSAGAAARSARQRWARPCAGRAACWPSAWRSPSSAGPSTRRPRSSPTSPSSCPRACRRSPTCRRCRSPRASAARSTSWSAATSSRRRPR